MSKESKDECKEYNSLKYRTMISTGANIDTFPDATEETLNQFLNMDIENNKKAVWSKLSKTEKLKKIKKYVKDVLATKHNLSDDESMTAVRFFTLMIDRKKLSKNNELSYNQENGNIDQIGGLMFNTDTRKFTIVLEQTQSKKKTKKII
jgi:L-rhamnose mutarotase